MYVLTAQFLHLFNFVGSMLTPTTTTHSQTYHQPTNLSPTGPTTRISNNMYTQAYCHIEHHTLYHQLDQVWLTSRVTCWKTTPKPVHWVPSTSCSVAPKAPRSAEIDTKAAWRCLMTKYHFSTFMQLLCYLWNFYFADRSNSALTYSTPCSSLSLSSTDSSPALYPTSITTSSLTPGCPHGRGVTASWIACGCGYDCRVTDPAVSVCGEGLGADAASAVAIQGPGLANVKYALYIRLNVILYFCVFIIFVFFIFKIFFVLSTWVVVRTPKHIFDMA